MSEFKIIDNYSKSLFKIGLANKIHEEIRDNLKILMDYLNKEKEILELFKLPIINNEEKYQIIELKLKALKLQPITLNFVKLLIKNHRLNLLSKILLKYEKLILDYNDIIDIEVCASYDINKDGKKIIEQYIKDSFKINANITYKIDDDLIGGIVIKHESKIYDFSIKGQLERLEKYLSVS